MWVDRWIWPPDDAAGAERLRCDLVERGVSLFHMPDALDDALEPDAFLQRILAQRPWRTVTTLIKPQPDAMKTTPLQRRAYPMNAGPAMLHVDSPAGGPLPPQLQVMICRHAAAEGGECQVLDMWPLLDQIEREDPDLYRDVFDLSRTVMISGKPHTGPLFAIRQGKLVLLYGYGGDAGADPLSPRLRRWIESRQLLEFRAERGDVYVNNNHRTLHGRRAFTDVTREFLRFLVWPTEPLAAPARFVERAQQSEARRETLRDGSVGTIAARCER
jgi:hypothetical protein